MGAHAPQVARSRATPDFMDGRQLCADADPDVFHPEGYSEADFGPARRICQGCPLAKPCLVWALRTQQEYGVWGATTPAERRRYLIILKNRGHR